MVHYVRSPALIYAALCVMQYQKCEDCDLMGTPYDCRSIMHYRHKYLLITFPIVLLEGGVTGRPGTMCPH